MRMNCQWIDNKTKTGSSRLKTLRTAEAVERVTNGGMRKLMHASAVRVVFDLPLPVLHFVSDPCTLVHLHINFTELSFQFFEVNLEIIVRNFTTRNK